MIVGVGKKIQQIRTEKKIALDRVVKNTPGFSVGKMEDKMGLRWMVAEMVTELEAVRQLMFSAAAIKDKGENYTLHASMAKLFASEMVNCVTAKALQIYGGYGFIKKYTVERFYRDARVFTSYEGTSEIQKVVISNHIFNDKRRM